MRQWLFPIILTAATGFFQVARSSTVELYINNGTVTTAPQIDARNFLNTGTFDASSVSSTVQYNTYSTLNYTNRGIMSASEGFRFDLTPNSGPRAWANNFTNTA